MCKDSLLKSAKNEEKKKDEQQLPGSLVENKINCNDMYVHKKVFIKASCLFRLLSPFRSINFHFSFVLYCTYIFNRIHRKKNEATNDDRIRRDTILQQPLLITFIQCYLHGAKLCFILDSNVHIFTKQYAYIKVN